MFTLNNSAPNLGCCHTSCFIQRVCYYFRGCLTSFTHDWTNVMSPGASESGHPWCWVTDSGAFYGFEHSATGRVKLLRLLFSVYLVSSLYKQHPLVFNPLLLYIQKICPISKHTPATYLPLITTLYLHLMDDVVQEHAEEDKCFCITHILID